MFANATVTTYNTRTGWCNLSPDDLPNQTAQLWIGAFFSGNPVRLPRVGDRIRVQLEKTLNNELVAVVGRLIKT